MLLRLGGLRTRRPGGEDAVDEQTFVENFSVDVALDAGTVQRAAVEMAASAMPFLGAKSGIGILRQDVARSVGRGLLREAQEGPRPEDPDRIDRVVDERD